MDRNSLSGKRLVRLPIASPRLLNGPEPAQQPAPSAPSPTDVAAQIDALNRTFAQFREVNDRAINELRNGRQDVVTTEHVDRINAQLTTQDDTLRQLSAELAAARLGGGNPAGAPTAAQQRYRDAFQAALRQPMSAPQHIETMRAAAMEIGGIQAALYTSSDPDGGFFVPTEMDAEISRIQGVYTPMRMVANVRSTTANSMEKLHSLGGATSGWVGEKTSRSETSNPTLSKLEFPTYEIYAEPRATQTILDDAPNVQPWLAGEVGIQFAEKEGDAWVRGDGSIQPRGYLSYTKVADASYVWGKVGYIASGVAAALTDASNNGMDALISLQTALKPAYLPNAQWMMNRATQAEVRKLKDGNDNYLWQPSNQAGVPGSLLGYPVQVDDNADVVGANKYPIGFADWRQAYRIVDRIGVRVLVDPYTAKPYVKFYTTKRVGGGIEDFEAIKLLKVATS